jgi:hypothetical protein
MVRRATLDIEGMLGQCSCAPNEKPPGARAASNAGWGGQSVRRGTRRLGLFA